MTRADKKQRLYWDIADRITNCMNESELSVKEIAERSGWSMTQVSLMKNGKQLPSLLSAIKLAAAMDVSMDALVNPFGKNTTKMNDLLKTVNKLNDIALDDVVHFAAYRLKAQENKEFPVLTDGEIHSAISDVSTLSAISKLDIIQFIKYRSSVEKNTVELGRIDPTEI